MPHLGMSRFEHSLDGVGLSEASGADNGKARAGAVEHPVRPPGSGVLLFNNSKRHREVPRRAPRSAQDRGTAEVYQTLVALARRVRLTRLEAASAFDKFLQYKKSLSVDLVAVQSHVVAKDRWLGPHLSRVGKSRGWVKRRTRWKDRG